MTLIECDAEFFAEDRFDAIDVVLQECEFLFMSVIRCRNLSRVMVSPLSFCMKRSSSLARRLSIGRRDGDVLSNEAFLDALILGGKASIHLGCQCFCV